MKTAHGTIFAAACIGACAVALGGCSTSSSYLNALLGSAVFSGTSLGTVSDVSADSRTSATIAYDDNGSPSDYTDDSATVQVKNGGQIKGPRTYVVDNDGSTAVGTNGVFGAYGVLEPESPDANEQSILIAKAWDYSQNGILERHNTTTGKSNTGSAFNGVAPSGTVPSGTVNYLGYAATSLQQGSSDYYFYAGTSTVDANFTDGTVTGTFDFSGASGPTLGFTGGTMSTNQATYSSTDVTYDTVTATGQVQGGFFGPSYVETQGAFDIQSSGGSKALGSFGGSNL